MTLKRKNLFIGIIAVLLVLVVGFVCVSAKGPQVIEQQIRTIELNTETDYASILNEFENSELKTEGSLTTFVGYQTLTANLLQEIDNVSESDVEQAEGIQIKYDFSYDSETNIVTLSAKMVNGDAIEIEDIYGSAFINDLGNIDAVMYFDGEYVLLSEMQNAGLIQNCGWFSNFFKAITKVFVVAVAVVACVATAGAGIGAVIAVGAAVSAGANVVEQLVDKGTVDFKEVALCGALGAIPVGGTAIVGAKVAAKSATTQAAKNAVKNTAKAVAKPHGEWKVVNEAMSDASRKYQTQITGRTNQVYVQNGTKFDGVIDGKLVDAKGHYSQFVDKKTGKFYGWFKGTEELKDEAVRQLNAAKGVPVQWYFAEKESMEAVKKLFGNEITGIEFIYQAMK